MLEVCVDSAEGFRIALLTGAERIELSEHLEVGGVTPAPQLILRAIDLRKSILSEIMPSISESQRANEIALIRCRPGDFYFCDSELRQMHDQAQSAVDLGCRGIAVGASVPGDELNWNFLESIAKRFRGVELVVHRVFDSVPNPMQAIPKLIDLGYRRILTSGGAERAEDSLEQLRKWQIAFGEQIEILPAGGVSKSNATQILNHTGCRQLHGSFRGIGVTQDSRDGNDNNTAANERLRLPDPDEIRTVRFLLDQWLANHP